MLKIYDKAQWHLDAGENEDTVISKFKAVLHFLDDKGFLTEEGKEILEIGIDSSVSLNERMVSEMGNLFLTNYYDDIINLESIEMMKELEKKYSTYMK